jgi:hypothetical protein
MESESKKTAAAAVPEPAKPKTSSKRNWPKLLGVIVAVVLIAIVAFVVIFGLGIYKKRWDRELSGNPSFETVVKIIPYPLMYVNSELVTLNYFRQHVEAMKHFFSTQLQTDFTSDEGKAMLDEIEDNVKKKLKNEALISSLAKQNGVSVKDSDIEAEFQNYVAQLGGQE